MKEKINMNTTVYKPELIMKKFLENRVSKTAQHIYFILSLYIGLEPNNIVEASYADMSSLSGIKSEKTIRKATKTRSE